MILVPLHWSNVNRPPPRRVPVPGPPCCRDGLVSAGIEDLARADPDGWHRRLIAGVPSGFRMTRTTTLAEVGRAAAWPSLLPETARDNPARLAARRQRFARVARALGNVPVVAVRDRDLQRARGVLARDRKGRARDPQVVRGEIRLLRRTVWWIQDGATGAPLFELTSPRPPKRQDLWVDYRTVERVLFTRPSIKTLAVLACAVSRVTQAEMRRLQVRNLTLRMGRLCTRGLTRRDGRRIPGRPLLVHDWARPLLAAWERQLRAAGLEDKDLVFPSETNQRRPASGLARLLDTACRRAKLPPIPWNAWGRLRDPVRLGFVAFALAASSGERRGKK